MNAEAPAAPSSAPEQTTDETGGFDSDEFTADESFQLDDQLEQSELERRTAESEGQIFGREALGRSKFLRQAVREQTFNRVSGLDMAKSEAENGIAGVRRKYLSIKKGAEEAKYNRYERKARTAIFAFRRENFAQKARWQKRRAENTSGLLAQHDYKFGPRDEKGKHIKGKRGAVYEQRKKLYIERAKELEKQRSKLLERRIVARERERRREMVRAAKNQGMSDMERARMTHLIDQLKDIDDYRKAVRKALRGDLEKRMMDFAKIVGKSDKRWRWVEEAPEDDEANGLVSELSGAVNANPEQQAADQAVSELDDAISSDEDMVE